MSLGSRASDLGFTEGSRVWGLGMGFRVWTLRFGVWNVFIGDYVGFWMFGCMRDIRTSPFTAASD